LVANQNSGALFFALVFKAAGHAFLLVHPSHRIGGSVAIPDGETAPNGSGDEIFGHSHAFYNRSLLRQTGGNSRGEDSTGAVSICRIDSLGPILGEISAIMASGKHSISTRGARLLMGSADKSPIAGYRAPFRAGIPNFLFANGPAKVISQVFVPCIRSMHIFPEFSVHGCQ
jgi:hypothetical protein